MKVKELIQKLSLENQEADIFITFNGCTESGEELAISDIEQETFVKIAADEDEESVCRLSEYDIEEQDILQKQEAVCLHSNRTSYFPFE